MPLAKPAKPDAITAVPTPVPLRTDRANFAVRGDAMMGWFPTGIAGVNTTLTYFGNAVNFVEQEANEAEASATAAAASNAAAAVNAAAAAASAGATVWVTGTTYAAGVVKYSPTNFQTYRDTVGGVSNTDPASDTTGRWISAMLPSAEAIGLPAMPPTAVFNFASGVIDRRFVESRSTAGTRYNIFGNLETLAAGIAKPTYDPATNEAKGYLAEPAATYLDMRSTEMDNASYWTSTNATPTPASAVGIDGALSMFKVEADSSASTNCYRAVVTTSASQYFAVRVKKGSGATDANLFVVFNNSTAATLAQLTINYDTGAVSQTIGSGATAEDVGHGGVWEIRIPVTSGIGVGNTASFYTGFADAVETAGEYAYISHVDVADKPNLTHIPTAGSNVTTVAGGLTMDLAAHDEIINPAGFTVVLSCVRPPDSDAPKYIFCAYTSSDTFTAIYFFSDYIRCYSVSGGVVVGAVNQTTVAAVGENVVLAASFGDGEVRITQFGASAVGSSALGSLPAHASLGLNIYQGASGYGFYAPLYLCVPFPRACTANELIALTRNL